LLNLQPEHAMLAPQKPKHTMLPVLVVLFLVSYGLMTMLVVEQGRTIETQRSLIHELFQDSAELSAIRGHAIHQGQVGVLPRSQAHAPLSQIERGQVHPGQVDATQAHPGAAVQDKAGNSRNSQKIRKQAPLKLPQVTSDVADSRRALDSI
jgi:hypothetical protein